MTRTGSTAAHVADTFVPMQASPTHTLFRLNWPLPHWQGTVQVRHDALMKTYPSVRCAIVAHQGAGRGGLCTLRLRGLPGSGFEAGALQGLKPLQLSR